MSSLAPKMPVCFVTTSNEPDLIKGDVRVCVCRDLPAKYEYEGQWYCLLHWPKIDKGNFTNFKQIVKEERFLHDLTDFRFVYFPIGTEFWNCTFNSDANFVSAIFGAAAYFDRAIFARRALFINTRFENEAIFNSVTFQEDTDFTLAEFSARYVQFNQAQFKGDNTKFYLTKFSGSYTEFKKASFAGRKVDFSSAKFLNGFVDFTLTNFGSEETDFSSSEFNGGLAIFSEAQFIGKSYFTETCFSKEAMFLKTQFKECAYFFRTHFIKTAYFENTIFEKQSNFSYSVFEKQAIFDKTTFKFGAFADFRLARFMDFIRLMKCKIENGGELYFGEATFEKPERVHFHSIPHLQPRWFINVDTRKFNFENVEFPELRGMKAVSMELAATRELLKRLEEKRDGEKSEESLPPNKLLSIACRRLAENAEENNRYDEAMEFRYMAMDVHRRETFLRRWTPFSLQWWYWISSGYGERWRKALLVLFLIWLLPFLFYASPWSVFHRPVNDKDVVLNYVTSDASGKVPGMADMPALSASREDNFRDAAFYSLNTMAFQKPEPKPANDSWLTRLVVILQTLLGPVQATLLLLAIRRKFMR